MDASSGRCERWRFLGIAMPRGLAPTSQSSEEIGRDGRFRFDVSISLPFVGPVIRYRGWLEPSPAQDVNSTGAPAVAPISRQV